MPHVSEYPLRGGHLQPFNGLLRGLVHESLSRAVQAMDRGFNEASGTQQ
jgi:hypothetical protein